MLQHGLPSTCILRILSESAWRRRRMVTRLLITDCQTSTRTKFKYARIHVIQGPFVVWSHRFERTNPAIKLNQWQKSFDRQLRVEHSWARENNKIWKVKIMLYALDCSRTWFCIPSDITPDRVRFLIVIHPHAEITSSAQNYVTVPTQSKHELPLISVVERNNVFEPVDLRRG